MEAATTTTNNNNSSPASFVTRASEQEGKGAAAAAADDPRDAGAREPSGIADDEHPLRQLLRVQERRAQAYARMHAGFRALVGAPGGGASGGGAAAKTAAGAADDDDEKEQGAPAAPSGALLDTGRGRGPAAAEAAYAALLSELTAEFSALSARARRAEAALSAAGAAQEAALVRAVQEGERDKLRLTLALQQLRRPHAARAFSWQRGGSQGQGAAADDAGIGGPLDPVELARARARGCGCGGGGGHSHHGGGAQKDQGAGAGGSSIGDDGKTAPAAAAASAHEPEHEPEQPPPDEPTEAEWRGAVDEAVRALDGAIGRINDAIEEARYALLELEGGEEA